MMVANSDSQRIGCVGRVDRLIETKECFDHLLDLAFICSAIPCDSALDLQRGILCDGKPVLRGSQKDNPPCLAQLERALCIFCEDQTFDRCPLRLMTVDQFGQSAEDLLQAGRKGVAGRRHDTAIFDGS